MDGPPDRRPRARVVLLTGPSGSGKSRIARTSGLPVLVLDDFYKDGDDPSAPRSAPLGGIVDWDDPRSWSADRAMAAVRALCATGAAEVPVYDISRDRTVGQRALRLDGATAYVAEGVFAAELARTCAAEGLLADAIVLRRHRVTNCARRLVRDLAERRKPPHTLLHRGWRLLRSERDLVASQVALGARPCGRRAAERAIAAASRPGSPAVPQST